MSESTKAGFNVKEWASATGIGRTKTYELIKDKQISVVKIGTRTIITTPPLQFLNSVRVVHNV